MKPSRSFRAPDPADPQPDFPLADLAEGDSAAVTAVLNGSAMRQRLLDLGLAAGTEVQCLGRSPAGDPSAYRIRGAVIALRREDSKKILVRYTDRKETAWD